MFTRTLGILGAAFVAANLHAEPIVQSEPFSTAVAVSAYLYDPGPGEGGVLPDFRKLNSTAVPASGLSLTPPQQTELKRILRQGPWPEDRAFAACFNPHHGFVFRDAQGRAVGTLDVCFECGNYDYGAPGYIERLILVREKFGNKLKQSGKRWDPELKRQEEAEVDSVRAEFHMPPENEALDWAGLKNLLKALGLPIEPTEADFKRVGKQNSH